jgi:hypothetical protein
MQANIRPYENPSNLWLTDREMAVIGDLASVERCSNDTRTGRRPDDQFQVSGDRISQPVFRW